MAGKFVKLAEDFWVAPQMTPDDVTEAAAIGVRLIINNRPDGEMPGQPKGADIEKAAAAAGLAYVAIPISGGVNDSDIDKFDAAMAATRGPALGFCRSGMRSALVRAFARARAGADIEAIIRETSQAGYDIERYEPHLAALAGDSRQ